MVVGTARAIDRTLSCGRAALAILRVSIFDLSLAGGAEWCLRRRPPASPPALKRPSSGPGELYRDARALAASRSPPSKQEDRQGYWR